jgi:hypothetical protein
MARPQIHPPSCASFLRPPPSDPEASAKQNGPPPRNSPGAKEKAVAAGAAEMAPATATPPVLRGPTCHPAPGAQQQQQQAVPEEPSPELGSSETAPASGSPRALLLGRRCCVLAATRLRTCSARPSSRLRRCPSSRLRRRPSSRLRRRPCPKTSPASNSTGLPRLKRCPTARAPTSATQPTSLPTRGPRPSPPQSSGASGLRPSRPR